uniref:C2H2-type domain-containing protein n=1 Tax=Heligmosomoides polygyrus TaxID=6339 RepID=A0A183FTJ8_HELPZ
LTFPLNMVSKPCHQFGALACYFRSKKDTQKNPEETEFQIYPLFQSMYTEREGCSYVTCANLRCRTRFCWQCGEPIESILHFTGHLFSSCSTRRQTRRHRLDAINEYSNNRLQLPPSSSQTPDVVK